MKEEQNIPMNDEQDELTIDYRMLLHKCLKHWRWFVASVLACLILAFIYIRYTAPVYNVTAGVLIQQKDQKGSLGAALSGGALGMLSGLGGVSLSSSFDNEVEIMQSRTLLKKVVTDLGLYISTAQHRITGYNIPLYKTSPIQVYLSPEEATELENGVKIKTTYTPEGKLTAHIEYVQEEEEQEIEKTFDKLPAVFPTPVGVLSFTKSDSLLTEIRKKESGDIRLVTYISSPIEAAKAYKENLTIEGGKKTTIAQVSLQDNDKQRATDFVNYLVVCYNQDILDEKSKVVLKTSDFIRERMEVVNQELSTTESEIADFKQKSGLTDLSADAQLLLQESAKYEQLRVENETQIRLVEFLRDYIQNPANANEVIPANVGLKEEKLTTAIDEYNSLLAERRRLLRTSSESNPAVINLNDGIQTMQKSIQTTVASTLKGLQITQNDLERQMRQFTDRISSAPQQEKEYINLARQQEIKSRLYLVLLQQREENILSLGLTTDTGRIVEEVLPDKDPVTPKKKIIALAALFLGLCIPAGVIFLFDQFGSKIGKRSDIEKQSNVPFLAELLHNQQNQKGHLVVRENQNGSMEEAFRSLRTQLLYQLGTTDKVILFTSAQGGEGTTFVASHTAASLAFLGKKVVVVDMNLRRPGLPSYFSLSPDAKGMTDYLNAPKQVRLLDLVQPSAVHANLDVLPGGALATNSTELVGQEAFADAIRQLKEKYDYVILDTAPLPLVTDTVLIGRTADICVFVCRAGVTPKSACDYLNTLSREQKFPKLAVLLNDVETFGTPKVYGQQ
ncbi:tyrosine-protein kinase family protein [Phocaeicola plebeius]|uniref:GumC family protein n=1 Tax=Phocaeicola plebeius TaxID=310297 RepID=UPI0026F10D1A|nr:tyrosine-protein kinase family protein [Phocaeicola plebeius]